MELNILETTPELIRAGYACPCGCRPSVDYARSRDVIADECCCGNQFAVGPSASATLSPRAGFHPESQVFDSPWGERLEAAWMVGPSVHEPAADHAHHEHHEPAHETAGQATDPVCGMTADPEAARAKGLNSTYKGVDYFFCGKGCKLEFDEDPERYLDPSYVPSM